MRNISLKYFEFGPIVQEEMSFKDGSYLWLWRSFCSVLPNHLCNYGSGPYVERFCETVLNLEQWFKRKSCLKTFLSRALSFPLFSRSEPFVQFW